MIYQMICNRITLNVTKDSLEAKGDAAKIVDLLNIKPNFSLSDQHKLIMSEFHRSGGCCLCPVRFAWIEVRFNDQVVAEYIIPHDKTVLDTLHPATTVEKLINPSE